MKNKNQITSKGILMLTFLMAGFIAIPSCGTGNKTDATVEEVKSALPEELKDSVMLQEEEKSALDKLNSISDSTSKK